MWSITAISVSSLRHRWSQLPFLATADGAHNGLRLFHLVEVHESGQIMLEVSSIRATTNTTTSSSSSSSSKANITRHLRLPPDFKYIIHTWRNRLPNKWDPIPEWDDPCWRHWVFKATSDAFRQRTPGTSAKTPAPNDTPRRAACAHGAQPAGGGGLVVSLVFTTRFTWMCPTRIPSREQIRVPSLRMLRMPHLLHMGGLVLYRASCGIYVAKTQALRGGLSLVNNTNLEYFNDTQCAELFRLKGTFLALLGRGEPANLAD